MGRKRTILTLLAVILFATSCGKPTEKEKMKQALKNYRKGMELYQKGDYGGAAEILRKAEAGMAYLSPEQIRRLKYRLALALYKDGKYEDAILELEDYIGSYPSAPNLEEAYYYLIKAYLKISPDPWRDQTYTQKALELIEEFVQQFPNSRYLPQIEELKEEALKKLALHHFYIAKFYEEYGYYYPAVLRYEYILFNYPTYINERELLFHYIKCLYLIPTYAKNKEREFLKKYSELKEKLKEGNIKDKKAAKKRLEFYLKQVERWENISKEAVQKADKNLQIYKQKFGEDKGYKILLKIKKEGKVEESWIEKIL